MKFETSLLREKFVLRDPLADMNENPAEPTIALSNRLVVALRNKDDKVSERYVVRGHNMHICVRMAARILNTFQALGPLQKRANPFDWADLWAQIVADFETAHNPQRWIAIYMDGKVIYKSGKRHPFLDLIEKCDVQNKGGYENSIPMAEDAFKKTGQIMDITYDGNVALNFSSDKHEAHCGIIMRGPRDTTTFKFLVTANRSARINPSQCLGTCAAYLEALQLCYVVGMNTEKIRLGLIKRFSKDEQKTREGEQRINRLRMEINNLESAYSVRYRPEKPDFQLLVARTEELAKQTLSG